MKPKKPKRSATLAPAAWRVAASLKAANWFGQCQGQHSCVPNHQLRANVPLGLQAAGTVGYQSRSGQSQRSRRSARGWPSERLQLLLHCLSTCDREMLGPCVVLPGTRSIQGILLCGACAHAGGFAGTSTPAVVCTSPEQHCTGGCNRSGHVTSTLCHHQALPRWADAAITLGAPGCVGTGLASGA